ncbi:MAG: hypothetical protein LBT48_04705, partial [Prevotellaceae bacterium]|nr:hypothetical protein [Prevotellaceae bacterium]
LSDIHVSWNRPDTVSLGDSAFPYSFVDGDGTKLYVPARVLAAYKASKQWLVYFSEENIVGE